VIKVRNWRITVNYGPVPSSQVSRVKRAFFGNPNGRSLAGAKTAKTRQHNGCVSDLAFVWDTGGWRAVTFGTFAFVNECHVSVGRGEVIEAISRP
jgi:hypothetical protein